ncbi:hypothetical protein BDZ45DRAFT_722132 [Acephala macrosclerotiorum]|nr:hypothetical protein BDZ45DRAFT_722132 [Acephala macrosclerotiorum]
MIESGQILLIICIIVSCLACATRFYLRVIVGKRVELLEFALIFATVVQLALIAMQLRIFQLLPTMQNPSSSIEVQKLFFSGTFCYLASLWAVKISINFLHIQLTRRFQRIRFLAVCHLYFLIGIWPFLYVVFIVACLPVDRRWALPSGRQCTPMIHAWEFWTHFTIHLTTDIILCILPFPALLKVTESRLRMAICGVYSIAFVAIIISIIRIVLLVTDVQNSIKGIMVLTAIEVTVCIVVGVLPGISSSFTKRYAQGGTEYKKSKSTHSSKSKTGKLNNPTFVQLSGNDTSVTKDGGDTDALELRKLGHHAYGFAEARGSSNSLTGSTDQIIDPAKGSIKMTTHVTIASDC